MQSSLNTYLYIKSTIITELTYVDQEFPWLIAAHHRRYQLSPSPDLLSLLLKQTGMQDLLDTGTSSWLYLPLYQTSQRILLTMNFKHILHDTMSNKTLT